MIHDLKLSRTRVASLEQNISVNVSVLIFHFTFDRKILCLRSRTQKKGNSFSVEISEIASK